MRAADKGGKLLVRLKAAVSPPSWKDAKDDDDDDERKELWVAAAERPEPSVVMSIC